MNWQTHVPNIFGIGFNENQAQNSLKSQSKQTQRSKLRIPVLDKHFEVE
jgi:hypothetical protein